MEQESLSNAVTAFLDNVIATLENDIALDTLPDAFAGAAEVLADTTAELTALRDSVIQTLADPTLATDLANATDDVERASLLIAALNSAGIDGLTAATGDAPDDVRLTLSDDIETNLVGLQGSADIGFAALGLSVENTVTVDAVASYAFTLDFDLDAAPASAVSFVDGGTPELTFALTGDVDFAGEGRFGLIGVEVTTDGDEPTDELSLNLALDLDVGAIGSGGGVVSSAILSGGLNGDFRIETQGLDFGGAELNDFGVIPSITANVQLGLNIAETDLLSGGPLQIDPNFALNEVGIRSEALANLFDGFLGELLSVVDVFPLRQLINLFETRIPVIGTFTDIQTFGDLAEEWAQGNAGLDFLVTIVRFAGIIDDLRALGSGQGIVLGNLSLDGAALDDLLEDGVLDAAGGDANPFDTLFGPVGDALGVDGLSDVLGDINTTFNDVTGLEGLTLNFLTEGPALLAELLLNGFSVSEEGRTLVTYELPQLAVGINQEIGIPLPPFPPLELIIGGGVNAGIALSVGYSTRGFFENDAGPLDGFFVAGQDGAPFASLEATLFAGLQLDAIIAQAGVRGGITGTLGINLGGQDAQGRSHLTDLSFPCIFENIEGALEAFVQVFIRIGLGAFSIERKKNLADAVLAQFSLDLCNRATDPMQQVFEIDDAGLAEPSSQDPARWLLNVGPRDGARNLEDDVDQDTNPDGTVNIPARNESYRIRLAGPDSEGIARPGALAIDAFGITQVIGEAPGESINEIRGDGGDGDDTLLTAQDVDVAVSLAGGAGNDLLSAGSVASTLSGGSGSDDLLGGTGNDTLMGDDGNDVLEGGGGADIIYGGADQDQVSYENSLQGITFQVNPNGPGFVGSGGDAEGDVLFDVEVIIGSREDDTFLGDETGENIIDAGAGDDSILGGNEDDFLIGGRGGDTIDGGAGTDLTSYALSAGAVFVDLSSGFAAGGDAEGDQLTSIESVQGTFYSDSLTSSGNDGALDGGAGDDVLRSQGGAVELFGGSGSDTVYADGDGDGDFLSGGGFYNVRPGRDLLSFRFAANAVTADLLAGVAGSDTIAGSQVVNDFDPVTFSDFETDLVDASGYSSFENLEGSNFDDDLTGDDLANTITGLSGDDTISGGEGADILIGSFGADILFGGAGSDWADYSDSFAGVRVFLGGTNSEGFFLAFGGGSFGTAEDDDLSADIENLRGSSRADTLTGNVDDNIIDPGIALSGIDTVRGEGTSDTDTLVLRYNSLSSGIQLFSNGTDGTVSGATLLNFRSIETFSITATDFDDIIFITDAFGDDVIFAGGGGDNILDDGGRDIILAGDGDDSVQHGGSATPTSTELEYLYLDGGAGIDRLGIDLGLATEDVVLEMGPDTVENPDQLLVVGPVVIANFEILGDVTTGSGNDILIQPGVHENTFFTGLGEDFVAPGLGTDSVNGGGGSVNDPDIDILLLDFSTSTADRLGMIVDSSLQVDQGFTLFGATGTAFGIRDDGLTSDDVIDFTGFERLLVRGTDGSDQIVGVGYPAFLSPVGDVLVGMAGGDTILGFAGNDTLIGGAAGGDDLRDHLYGGDGGDLFVLGDGTGYFYGDPSPIFANGDAVFVRDFDPTEGDRLQLFGDSSLYATNVIAGNTFLTFQGDQFASASFTGFTDLDLDADYVSYVSAGSDSTPFAVQAAGIQAAASEFAAVARQAGLAAPSEAELVASALPTGADIAQSFRDGTADLATAFDALAYAAQDTSTLAAPSAPESDTAENTDTPPSPPLVIESTGNEGLVVGTIVREQITEALRELQGGTGGLDIVIGLTSFGSPLGFGQVREGFGTQGGAVISSGEAERLAGPNELDGSLRSFESTRQFVQLEEIGSIGSSNILRADVTGLDISQIRLIDANLLIAGTGRATGADINTIIFSNEDISGNVADFDTISRLDVMDFTPLGAELDLGPSRNTTVPLAGEFNGFLDNTSATLDQREAFLSVISDGYLSLGDGGEATFFLDAPIVGSEEPTYLYIAEFGTTEIPFLEIGSEPEAFNDLEQTDLSTDFGAPGATDDNVGFDITVGAFASGVPDNTVVWVDLFQVIGAFESLLEGAGEDIQDRFRVTVNGFDALTLRDGTPATLNLLARSPFGAFHPDLILNPAGDGPMADVLRADAFTEVLTVRAPIFVNQTNEIRIEVEDRGDGLLDTALFLLAPGSIENTLADVVSVFDDPADSQPSGVFNDLDDAIDSASSGNLIVVGDEAVLAEGVRTLVTREDLIIETEGDAIAELELEGQITALSVAGDAGFDVLGNALDNSISAGNGNDTLDAGEGNDTINASAGDDLVSGGLGNDTLDGSRGEDTISFATLEAPGFVFGDQEFGVFVNLGEQGRIQETGAGRDVFTNFENLEGSQFADLLTGDRGANRLEGLDGADVINGGLGDDMILGGAGFDAVEGGPGADMLFGGTGGNAVEGDIVTYFSATGPLVFDFGATLFKIDQGSSAEVLEDTIGEDIEGIAGASNHANTFLGDELTGLTLFLGGARGDTFEGGSGVDQILGLAGNDVIYGNDGGDGLIGEGGDDDLFGGAGGDAFFFDGINEGDDTIHDLELGADLIFFTGGNVTAFRVDDTDADGNGVTDALLTYQVDAVDAGTITIIDIDAATVESDATIVLG